MTLRRIALVGWHVFKESVRDRVLYSIAAFAVLLVAAALAIGQITAGQDLKIIKDLGLATIELAGVLMAIFIGVGLVSREIDRRSIFGLLAKPLPRWEFVIGKYMGLVLTVTVNIWAMTFAFYLMLGWLYLISPANLRMAWEAPALDPRLALQVVLFTAELALLTAIALFFSTFSSSGLISVVFTVGLYVLGLASRDLRAFPDVVEVNSLVGQVVSAIGWLVPAFSGFDVKNDVVHGFPISPGLVGSMLLYAGIYSSTLVGASIAIFSRREFK
jgi:Cu-processing system permease protein